MDLSRYAAATLHQDSEFMWCRGRAPASLTPHRPSVRGSIHRSEHPGRRPRQQLCSAATLSGASALVVCRPVVINSLDLFAHSASTGPLTGTVTDPPRADVQNAQITLRTNGTAETRTAITDQGGSYRFSLLRPGKDQLAVGAIGFAPFVVRAALIQITKVRSIAVRLALQGVKQEVIVEAPLLQMGNVALGRVIARETIETLPLVAMIMNPGIMQSGLKLEF
jgi:Carboxypeptidase regulatory-like domain